MEKKLGGGSEKISLCELFQINLIFYLYLSTGIHKIIKLLFLLFLLK